MKFRLRLLFSMLLVAVLPMLILNRYAFAFFHHYSKNALEREMAHSARLAAELFGVAMADEARADLLASHAAATESRIRYWDADRQMRLDAGESPGLLITDNPEVDRAFAQGQYAARWQLTQDRSRVYYFAALPRLHPESGEVTGVAQVIRHTAPVTRALLRMKEHQTRITWITAGLSAALALLFALILSRRLRSLQKAAHQYAKTGDSSGFSFGGRDDFSGLALSFQQLTVELEKRQAYNRDFVITTLHELKTPLTAILGAGDLLRRPELAETDRRRFADNIHIQATRLRRLVEELRALTALDADLPREPALAAEAAPLISEILERVRPALSRPVTFREDGLRSRIQVRPQRLEQALVNLLENAERHSPDGQSIAVELAEAGDTVQISICDRGPGIAPENLERIFQPFFTTLPRGTHPDQGLGLGLSVVQSIVNAHGGSVRAGPGEGGGSVFTILLPVFQSSSLSSNPSN